MVLLSGMVSLLGHNPVSFGGEQKTPILLLELEIMPSKVLDGAHISSLWCQLAT
jgi:hypothetical protein